MTYKVLKNKYNYYKILKMVDFKLFKVWLPYNGFNHLWLDLIASRKLFKSLEDVTIELQCIKKSEEIQNQKDDSSYELVPITL